MYLAIVELEDVYSYTGTVIFFVRDFDQHILVEVNGSHISGSQGVKSIRNRAAAWKPVTSVLASPAIRKQKYYSRHYNFKNIWRYKYSTCGSNCSEPFRYTVTDI